MELLTTTTHNGFPVVNKEGRLRGLVLRKTLCGMLKQKAYSTPLLDRKSPSGVAKTADGGMVLAEAATVSYENLERPYPNFPDAKSVKLSDRELVSVSYLFCSVCAAACGWFLSVSPLSQIPPPLPPPNCRTFGWTCGSIWMRRHRLWPCTARSGEVTRKRSAHFCIPRPVHSSCPTRSLSNPLPPRPPTTPPTPNLRCFRTMGYRHMVVVDGEFTVVGMITRSDMNEHTLKHYWEEAGEQMQNDMKVDTLPPAIVYEIKSAKPEPPIGGAGMRSRSGSVQSDHSNVTIEEDVDQEIFEAYQDVSDSPTQTLRKKLSA